MSLVIYLSRKLFCDIRIYPKLATQESLQEVMMESKVKFFFLFSWFETERFPHVLVLGSCYLVRLKLFWRWFVSYEALHPIKQEVLFSCLDSSNKAKKNPIFLFFLCTKMFNAWPRIGSYLLPYMYKVINLLLSLQDCWSVHGR